jgi:hypothetical protein
MELEYLFPCSQDPAMRPYPELIPLHILPPYFFTISFNIILPGRFFLSGFRTRSLYVGLAVMKSSVFRDITPCSLLEVNRRVEGTCRLHIQGRRLSQSKDQHEAGSKQRHYFLRPQRWRRPVPPKHRLTFIGL